jgi:hypothetical protein
MRRPTFDAYCSFVMPRDLSITSKGAARMKPAKTENTPATTA